MGSGQLSMHCTLFNPSVCKYMASTLQLDSEIALLNAKISFTINLQQFLAFIKLGVFSASFDLF